MTMRRILCLSFVWKFRESFTYIQGMVVAPYFSTEVVNTLCK